MNTNFILSFALLFAATIALYCSIVYGLNARKKRIAKEEAEIEKEQTYTD